MRNYLQFYINGAWVDPATPKTLAVTDPATAQVCGHISLGSAADVDNAVKAAAKAFRTWSRTTREQRLAVLDRIIEEFTKRVPELGDAITEEMGAPKWLAHGTQAASGVNHFKTARTILVLSHRGTGRSTRSARRSRPRWPLGALWY